MLRDWQNLFTITKFFSTYNTIEYNTILYSRNKKTKVANGSEKGITRGYYERLPKIKDKKVKSSI